MTDLRTRYLEIQDRNALEQQRWRQELFQRDLIAEQMLLIGFLLALLGFGYRVKSINMGWEGLRGLFLARIRNVVVREKRPSGSKGAERC
jgi:hypothetical protein